MQKKITYRIGDVSKIYSGGDRPEIYSEIQNSECPIPIYSNGLDNEGLYGYTNKSQIEGDCITVAARGVNIGTVFYRPTPFLPIVRLLSVIPDRTLVNAKYLYYYFQIDTIIGTGSAQPQLTIPFFQKKKILIHEDISYQQKIASILSAYDNLIQNYKKQIEALQTAASELYKEWFVRFRFPGWQNAEFENGIPKGWKVEKLGECISFERGVGYSSEDIFDGDNVLLSMNNIQPFGGFIRDYTRPYSGKYKDFQLVKENDLIMSITDMTQDRRIIGYVGMVPPNKGNLVISTHLLKLSSQTLPNEFLFFHFNYSNLSRIIAERATGTNVLGLTSDILRKIRTLFPSFDLIQLFSNKTKPIIKRINSFHEQIDNLTQQRDLLLPRLMSGKLEVK